MPLIISFNLNTLKSFISEASLPERTKNDYLPVQLIEKNRQVKRETSKQAKVNRDNMSQQSPEKNRPAPENFVSGNIIYVKTICSATEGHKDTHVQVLGQNVSPLRGCRISPNSRLDNLTDVCNMEGIFLQHSLLATNNFLLAVDFNNKLKCQLVTVNLKHKPQVLPPALTVSKECVEKHQVIIFFYDSYCKNYMLKVVFKKLTRAL